MAEDATPKKRHGEPPSVDYLPAAKIPEVVHLSDDEFKSGEACYAKYLYLAKGRGNYDGTGGTNTVLESFHDEVPQHLVLPVVRLGAAKAEIDWNKRTFVNVPLAAAEVLKVVLDNFPAPVGLNSTTGAQSQRAIKDLPEELQSHIQVVKNKGYKYVL